ncbi:MAG: MASE1 domain-containing protein [Burkholderiaceae bacterium]|nr:MASE1 domain-containing protein [Burkholderiaceae bacterium]
MLPAPVAARRRAADGGAMQTRADGRKLIVTLVRVALLTVAYAATGLPALRLTIPPGYAAAIFPPAGIMLAAGVIYGYRVLPGALFGSLLLRFLAFGLPAGPQAHLVELVTVVIALASMLQAAVGTRLVRGLCGTSPALDTPATIVRFVLLCPLAALVGSTISTTTLVQCGIATPVSGFFYWWNWWMGDTLGMLVAVPIVMALFGKPREHWAARRWTVALPLLAMILLGALVCAVIANWEQRRVEQTFGYDAKKLVNAFRNELRLDLLAVEAAAYGNTKLGSPPAWLGEAPSIHAVGRVSLQGGIGATALPVVEQTSRKPSQDRAILARPSVQEALKRALMVDDLAASEPWTTGKGASEQAEFLVWIPLPAVQRKTNMSARKLAYAILNINHLDPRPLGGEAADLAICWLERTAAGASRRIAGPPQCERPVRDLSLEYEEAAPLWGRNWLVRVVTTPGYLEALRSWGAWAFSALTVLGIGATGIFLLLLAARARAINTLVTYRTEQLEREKRAAREAELARVRAEEATRAKDRFLSRASHELRTPLNGILGFAQILLHTHTEALSEQQRKQLQRIESAGWHLQAMIDDLLDLSRIEAGTIRLAPEPIALEPVVEEVTSLLSEAAASQDVMLRVDTGATDATGSRVLADATRLRQVLTNLVSNAIKYNRHGGSVTIGTRREGDQIVITVSDTGQGMSASQLAELFQPFNRLGRESGPVQGTGLGLVVTRNLVELMNGRMEVASVEGQGTSIAVRLPAATAADEPTVPPVPSEDLSPLHEHASSR